MNAAGADALLVQLALPTGDWVDVGVLCHSGEVSWFDTLPSYWGLGDRPILGQVFEERGPGWRFSARVRLPTWFSHLLPEGQLRSSIAHAARVNAEREFFLLQRIGGDDLPGALRVRRYDMVTEHAVPDADVAASDENADDGGALKFSLAGIQLKFSVVYRDSTLTIPARGQAGDWIAKLPDQRGFDRVPEAEFAGLELAGASGIDIPEARLVDVAEIRGLPSWAAVGGRALLVRRFDRTPGGGRVHVEELAQVLGVSTGHEHARYRSANFETVARTTAALCGPAAVAPVIDRIVLNVLLGNGDAHTKNWAYRYPDGRSAELSPAYDIVPTVLYLPDDDLGMNLAGSRSFERVTFRSFERLADRAGWDGALGRARAAEAVKRVIEAWPVLSDLLPRDDVRRLTARRDGLPLVQMA